MTKAGSLAPCESPTRTGKPCLWGGNHECDDGVTRCNRHFNTWQRTQNRALAVLPDDVLDAEGRAAPRAPTLAPSASALFEGRDIREPDDRAKMRTDLMQQIHSGQIDSHTGGVLLQYLHSQSREKPKVSKQTRPRVQFVVASSREKADGINEAKQAEETAA